MPLTRVNLLAGFNRDDSPAWSVQDVCNYLPVVADQPGTTTEFKLRTPPGLRQFQEVGRGPIRGIHNCEGRMFVVSAQTLYEVRSNGEATSRGTIPGVGRVRMAHNQVKNGNQLAVVNGQSGYIYNTATQAFTRITDDGFPGAIDVKFIDGYLFYVEPFGRFWLHSDLADGLSYNTLDRGEAESQPDRLVGLAVNQGEVILFGERTTEFYGNTGEATGTFQSKDVTTDVGCASLHTIQNLDNSVMWLGNDGVIYRLDGYRAVPISTRAIEKAIAKYDWKNAFAFTWEDEGHKVYYVTFPDGETFGYDVVVGLWHRRESLGFSRWRLNGCASWGRQWVGTDFQNGQLWVLDWNHVLEGGDELVATYTTSAIHMDGNRFDVPEAELIFTSGQIPTARVVEEWVPIENAGWSYGESVLVSEETASVAGNGSGGTGWSVLLEKKEEARVVVRSYTVDASEFSAGEPYEAARVIMFDGSGGQADYPNSFQVAPVIPPDLSIDGWSPETMTQPLVHAIDFRSARFAEGWNGHESYVMEVQARRVRVIEPDHNVLIRYSKDGGHNWSNWKKQSLGAVGEYQDRTRVRLTRLGLFRQVVFQIRVSSPVKRDLLGASIRIEPRG